MTPEEVWEEACATFTEASTLSTFNAANQAAVSVIRTAMEAYAAEKVAEERAAIAAWISSEGGCWPRGTAHATILARAIMANQHHGGKDG